MSYIFDFVLRYCEALKKYIRSDQLIMDIDSEFKSTPIANFYTRHEQHTSDSIDPSKCGRCKRNYPKKKCPTDGVRCKNCDGLGHLAPVCQSPAALGPRSTDKDEKDNVGDSAPDDTADEAAIDQANVGMKMSTKVPKAQRQLSD